MLEAGVDGARVEEGGCTELLELTESLEDWSVDGLTDEGRESDVFVDAVEEDSGLLPLLSNF